LSTGSADAAESKLLLIRGNVMEVIALEEGCLDVGRDVIEHGSLLSF
jgi:hypothetical protein